jgi:hypothetical protein
MTIAERIAVHEKKLKEHEEAHRRHQLKIAANLRDIAPMMGAKNLAICAMELADIEARTNAEAEIIAELRIIALKGDRS